MARLAITQPPFNTTFMGMAAGACAGLGIPVSAPTLFGASGHAFVINLHSQLCPSSPYVFDRSPIEARLRNLGLVVNDLGYFGADAPPEERARIAETMERELDAGRPCGLVNMEFQLVTGYDDTGFDVAQPWPGMDFPPGRLDKRTWAEWGAEVHAGFYTFQRCPAVDPRSALREALVFAVEVWDSPTRWTQTPYGMGPDAYRHWLSALDEHAQGHGHWWNASVWGECRAMAAAYLDESASLAGGLADAAADYREIASLFAQVADRTLDSNAKRPIVEKLAVKEQEAVERLRTILATW